MRYLLFLCIAIIFFIDAYAQGNLMVMPRRVVFDNQRRTQDVNLANTGSEKATYAISFQEIRMTEDGQFQPITAPDPGQLWASPYLRVFPRRVTLAPNESQTIKLQFNRGATMQEGEYRSHLYLRAVPNNNPLGEEQENKDSTISIRITPVFGFTIPVIIEVGSPAASASLSEAKVAWKEGQSLLDMVIERKGNKSVYGNITVQYIAPDGKSTDAGMVKGLAVYTPTSRRHILMALNKVAGVDYRKGHLKISYEEDATKPNVFATSELELK